MDGAAPTPGGGDVDLEAAASPPEDDAVVAPRSLWRYQSVLHVGQHPGDRALPGVAVPSATRKVHDDLAAGRPARQVTMRDRGEFLLEYIDLLLNERVGEAEGFRHTAPTSPAVDAGPVEMGLRAPARGRERWVVNKLRALNGWYSKGYEGGAQFRTAVNQADSIAHVRELIDQFFIN